MQGLTFIFHVFSACVIFGMTFWIIRLQSQIKFQSFLWNSVGRGPNKVYVDWPESFLGRFSQAISADFTQENPSKGAPCAIKAGPWVKAHIKFNILSIKLDKKDCLMVTLKQTPPELEACQRELQESIPRIISLTIAGSGI